MCNNSILTKEPFLQQEGQNWVHKRDPTKVHMEEERATDRFTIGSQISAIPFQPPPIQLAVLSCHQPPSSLSIPLFSRPRTRYMMALPAPVGPRQEICMIDEEVVKMRKKDKTDRKRDKFTAGRKKFGIFWI
jgi:hypothetical protein